MKSIIHSSRIRFFALVILCIAVVAVGSLLVAAATVAKGEPEPPVNSSLSERPLPSPVPTPSQDDSNCTTPACRAKTLIAEYKEKAIGKSAEEVAALKQELAARMEQEGLGKIVDCNSPEAWGAEIELAGKMIKLPEDARPWGFIASVGLGISPDGKCYGCEAAAQVPITVIVRGESSIYIGKTGTVIGGNIAPDEIGAFDFLKEVLPDQTEAIDSLPIAVPVKNPQLVIVDTESELAPPAEVGQ